MAEPKRMRVFAGPNGSGKTTIISKLREKIPFGVYVNADDIEIDLHRDHRIDLSKYDLKITAEEVRSHFKMSQLSPVKHKGSKIWEAIEVQNNKLVVGSSVVVDSYLAADIAELLRLNLLGPGLPSAMRQ